MFGLGAQASGRSSFAFPDGAPSDLASRANRLVSQIPRPKKDPAPAFNAASVRNQSPLDAFALHWVGQQEPLETRNEEDRFRRHRHSPSPAPWPCPPPPARASFNVQSGSQDRFVSRAVRTAPEPARLRRLAQQPPPLEQDRLPALVPLEPAVDRQCRARASSASSSARLSPTASTTPTTTCVEQPRRSLRGRVPLLQFPYRHVPRLRRQLPPLQSLICTQKAGECSALPGVSWRRVLGMRRPLSSHKRPGTAIVQR